MRQTQIGVLIMLIGGCATTSNVKTVNETWDNFRDVCVLAILVQEYLRSTDGRNFNLDELLEKDSLGKISKNFERIEQVNRGGHIAVFYKFSNTRNGQIDLTDQEKQVIDRLRDRLRVREKKFKNSYDGEIRFDYGERFYKLEKVIIAIN